MGSCELPEIGIIVFDTADVIPDSHVRGPEPEIGALNPNNMNLKGRFGVLSCYFGLTEHILDDKLSIVSDRKHIIQSFRYEGGST
jgi:hypothetical protein